MYLYKFYEREKNGHYFLTLNKDGVQQHQKVIEPYCDIMEPKKIKDRLLMFERALNQTSEGIAIADMEGCNQFVNPAWAQIHGYSVEEMTGAHLSDFHPEEQLKEIVNPFMAKVMEHGYHQAESEHTHKDGTRFPTDVTVNVIKDDNDRVLGIVGTVRDISEKKAAEAQIEQYRNHLEKMVEERTSALKESNEKLTHALAHIKELNARLENENTNLREELRLENNFQEIIGQSDPLKYVFYRIEDVAPTDATVLILGETGTGKELVARAIHKRSDRKSGPLIKVDCASLPENLIESELFGHEKGAFSGAVERRKGRFEIADGATLFLDEIGELALNLQGKLLRVLQDGEFERLGSSHTIKTDVRVIAATNRNLKEEVKKGRFREDLWYRLNIFSIHIPPLRDRSGDIPLLVNWFTSKFSRKFGKKITTISEKTMASLLDYRWPGNVRELSNTIESAMISCRDETLRIVGMSERSQEAPDSSIISMVQAEKEHIIKALKACNWQVEGEHGAAGLLNLNPGTLRGRMRKYDIKRPDANRTNEAGY